MALALVVAAPGVVKSDPRNLSADLLNLNVRLTTEHYSLAGTVNDARLNDFAAALEFIHAEYATGFAELFANLESAELNAPREAANSAANKAQRFSVVILAKEGEYKEFTQAYFDRRVEHTRGLFVPSVDLLVILDFGDASETYTTLFHEAFHQFLHRHVPYAPMWVNEGLATYYETARPTGGGLAFDRKRDEFFQVVKEAADAKLLIPFDILLAAGQREFYEPVKMPTLRFPRSVIYYAQSYTLCAYILSDNEGRMLLRRYLQTLAAATSDGDAARITAETFPETLLEALVTPWLQYVNKN